MKSFKELIPPFKPHTCVSVMWLLNIISVIIYQFLQKRKSPQNTSLRVGVCLYVCMYECGHPGMHERVQFENEMKVELGEQYFRADFLLISGFELTLNLLSRKTKQNKQFIF